MSYITVTRKHSSRRLCTQLGRATLDLMFKSQITTTLPISVLFCYKVANIGTKLVHTMFVVDRISVKVCDTYERSYSEY